MDTLVSNIFFGVLMASRFLSSFMLIDSYPVLEKTHTFQVIQYVTKLYPQTLEVTQPLKGSRITIPKSSQRIARKKSSNYLTYQTANAPENGWLEDDFPFRETLFSGAMLVFGRVINRWASREVKSISFCAESESE